MEIIKTQGTCFYTDSGVSIKLTDSNDGIETYLLTVKPENGENPSQLHIFWKEKMQNQIGVWMPLMFKDNGMHQWFGPSRNVSRFCFGSPIASVYGNGGMNSVTVALSDSIQPTRIHFSVDDLNEKDEVTFDVFLLDGEVDPFTEYNVYLRIDRRGINYCDALTEASGWMDGFLSKLAYLPDAAEMPLYSSWYNFHQYPTQGLLTEELELAAKMGFKTAILDDGWQFEGPTCGAYDFCGAWKVAKDKFPDFGKFVDDAHRFGIKLLVWFVVPFVGIETEEFRRFKSENKLLYVNEGCRAGVLDIRFKDVREHIINIYRDFVDTYGIDGLKLDFIDSFYKTAESRPYCDEMDCETVDGAVQVLLDGIFEVLLAKNPEFMFEFRQCYIGKEIVNRCNMLRVCDCAYDAIINRLGIVSLRLLNSHTAIHSDMLLWAKTETPVNCAHQLLNVMFGVPQISVLLTKIPECQLDVLKCFTDYWTENRDVLLHGHFVALNPESNYSAIYSETTEKRVTVLYSRRDWKLCGKPEDIFNNTDCDGIFVESQSGYTYSVYDFNGILLSSGYVTDKMAKIDVPEAGRCEIIPQ